MIKKRYLTILCVAIVSVLLGSLFYNSTTQAQSGKPKNYKDSLSISLLRVGASGWASQGVKLAWSAYEFPFVFNPKDTFQNVTSLWFSFLYCTTSQPVTIEISLNGIFITSKSLSVSTNPSHISFQATDTSFHYALTSGINVLTLTITEIVYLQDSTVFIEYEYLAR